MNQNLLKSFSHQLLHTQPMEPKIDQYTFVMAFFGIFLIMTCQAYLS